MKEKKYVKLTESKFDDLQTNFDNQIAGIVKEKEHYNNYIDDFQSKLDNIQEQIKNLERQIDKIIYEIKKINNTIVHKENCIIQATNHYNECLEAREYLNTKLKAGVINRNKSDNLNNDTNYNAKQDKHTNYIIALNNDITNNMKQDKSVINKYTNSITNLNKRKAELKKELNELKNKIKALFNDKKDIDRNMKIATKNIRLCDRNLNSVHNTRSNVDKLFLMTSENQDIADDIFVPKIKKMKKIK